MRKIFLAVVLAASLAGCASLQTLSTAVHYGTASIDNPITPTRLNQIEAGTKVVFRALNVWRRACLRNEINANCKEQIRAVQIYTIPIERIYLPELRQFVRQNDQVNAVKVFNTVTELLGKAKARAAEAGQIIPGS